MGVGGDGIMAREMSLLADGPPATAEPDDSVSIGYPSNGRFSTYRPALQSPTSEKPLRGKS